MPDDKLRGELERFERGEAPSPFGELIATLPRGPVSQQASRTRKDDLTRAVRTAFDKYQFYLTGDVQLELQWLVHERARYESDEAADVDNILKPTLDALSGPAGILIDDCQIQSVSSSWIDWNLETQQQLTIRLRHIAKDYLPRRALAFVELGRNLYLPVSTDLPEAARAGIAKHLASAVAGRDKLVLK